jgi:hypothetical protein
LSTKGGETVTPPLPCGGRIVAVPAEDPGNAWNSSASAQYPRPGAAASLRPDPGRTPLGQGYMARDYALGRHRAGYTGGRTSLVRLLQSPPGVGACTAEPGLFSSPGPADQTHSWSVPASRRRAVRDSGGRARPVLLSIGPFHRGDVGGALLCAGLSRLGSAASVSGVAGRFFPGMPSSSLPQ